jgi:hypothetical protein
MKKAAWLKSPGRQVATWIGVGVAIGIGIGLFRNGFDADADCYPSLNHAKKACRLIAGRLLREIAKTAYSSSAT